MKKLALLMFALLILGCGTETPIVEEPEPITEEHIPTVVSGEHLRIDIDLQIVFQTVWDGQDDVDPERINASVILFEFDEDLKMRKVDFLREGKPLHWIGTGLSDHVAPTVLLSPVAGMELEFDTEYVIKMYVQDLACHSFRFEIRFRTKPKP